MPHFLQETHPQPRYRRTRPKLQGLRRNLDGCAARGGHCCGSGRVPSVRSNALRALVQTLARSGVFDLQRPRCRAGPRSARDRRRFFFRRSRMDRPSDRERRSRARARMQVHAQRQCGRAAATADRQARAGRRVGRGAGSQLPRAVRLVRTHRGFHPERHDDRPRRN